GQRSVNHCRLNHRSLALGGGISSTAIPRGGTGDCVGGFSSSGRAIHSEIFTDRKSDAGRRDVGPERDRGHRGNCRVHKKVIAWQEFVSGRGGPSCWCYSARSSPPLFIAGSRWSDCST